MLFVSFVPMVAQFWAPTLNIKVKIEPNVVLAIEVKPIKALPELY